MVLIKDPSLESLPDSLPDGWVHLDELANALDSVEMATHFLENLPDPYRWKWAVMAFHQAIYGFAICAVRGTDSRSVLEPADTKGERRLISVWKALERAQNPAFLWNPGDPLTLSDDEKQAIDTLFDEYRNGLAHFRPAGWSIELLAIVDVLRLATAVLRRLAVAQGLVLYRDKNDEVRVSVALDSLEGLLAAYAPT